MVKYFALKTKANIKKIKMLCRMIAVVLFPFLYYNGNGALWASTPPEELVQANR